MPRAFGTFEREIRDLEFKPHIIQRDRKNCLEWLKLTEGNPTAYICTPRVNFKHNKKKNKVLLRLCSFFMLQAILTSPILLFHRRLLCRHHTVPLPALLQSLFGVYQIPRKLCRLQAVLLLHPLPFGYIGFSPLP